MPSARGAFGILLSEAASALRIRIQKYIRLTVLKPAPGRLDGSVTGLPTIENGMPKFVPFTEAFLLKPTPNLTRNCPQLVDSLPIENLDLFRAS